MRVVPGLSLTIDCRDPGLLVPFWCEALAYVPAPAPEGHATWRSFYLSIGESEESLGEGDACDRVIDPEVESSRVDAPIAVKRPVVG